MAKAKARVKLSPDLFAEVVQKPQVRAELAKVAHAIAATAKAIANAENVDTEITVETGTRPRGRTFAHVVSDDNDGSEFGNAKTPRRRVLGRAAGIRIN